ncbi:argininosuccinate lyase [Candidatus Gracilibacteria bacterium]|nr:argininosuccinate lyase [Candidatus Gracilibacteria bacterium]
MSKLWQTSHELNKQIEKFTVGNDYLIDQIFLPYDIKASLAHAKMLQSIGIITKDEFDQASQGLSEILSKVEQGIFSIDPSEEDGHTAIENYLTKHYGEVGKKIHTGRSRNDQSLTMIRLYLKDILEESLESIDTLISVFDHQIQKKSHIMPGYTHWQKAMPTDTKTWLGSFHDAFTDQALILKSLTPIFDQSPLGSAAGFGITNFANNREFTAKEMGFSKVQENPMYSGLSRGLFEHDILSALGNFLMIISRLNNDILLFTTSEFGYLSLPDTMTTGSSIMPQKRNYDVCELIRAKISLFFGYSDQMRNIYTHLMSGYQRDLQMTKSILINGYTTWKEIIDIMVLVGDSLTFHEANLEASMTPELYATDEVYKLVMQGESFRDAYQKIKNSINDVDNN